jgi:hypothetical protein
MRFIVFVKASRESESGTMPDKNELMEMQSFNQKLVDAGMMLAGEGLKPSSTGARIDFDKGTPKVSDGPFAETKELVAGYWVLEASSKDEVIDWMKRAPFKEGALEIREITEDEEFAYAPEVMAQEKKLRAQIAQRHPRN